MKRFPVISSNIKSIGHSDKLNQLDVEFKNGKLFAYKDVTQIEYLELIKAPSLGSHFSRHIKHNHECFEFGELDLSNVKVSDSAFVSKPYLSMDVKVAKLIAFVEMVRDIDQSRLDELSSEATDLLNEMESE